MNVYLDESGDLGWRFDKPFRKGGSSRYLTIAFLVCPTQMSKYPKRIMRGMYKYLKQNPSDEIKGKDLETSQKLEFASRAVGMVSRHPKIKMLAITAKKENVQAHIRQDPNKLYNWMINLALLRHIKTEPIVNFIPDPRSIKVASGNSLLDYLQIKLWFELNSMTIIRPQFIESHMSLGIQFADIMANIIWDSYERGKNRPSSILGQRMIRKHLFF